MKVANIIGVKGNFLQLQSIRPKEEAIQEGRCFEWEINLYTFKANPEHTKDSLGLNDTEYNSYLGQLENA